MNKKRIKNFIYIISILVFLVIIATLVVFLLIKKGEYDSNQEWRSIIAETTGYKWSDQTKQIKIIENMSDIEEVWDAVIHIQVPQEDIDALQNETNFSKCSPSESLRYDLVKILFDKDYRIPPQADVKCVKSLYSIKNTNYMATFLFNSESGEIWIVASHITPNLPQTTPPNVETTKNIYDKNGKLLYEVYDKQGE
jgi:hypothetical protein